MTKSSRFCPITPLKTTVVNQSRYRGIIKKYRVPAFGKLSLRDITALGVQQYFASFTTAGLQHETVDKIRDVLASILSTAGPLRTDCYQPMRGHPAPALKRGKHAKPYITPQQFAALVDMIQVWQYHPTRGPRLGQKRV